MRTDDAEKKLNKIQTHKAQQPSKNNEEESENTKIPLEKGLKKFPFFFLIIITDIIQYKRVLVIKDE